MAAYIVFTGESTHDSAALATYSQNVGPALAGHPVTVLGRRIVEAAIEIGRAGW